MTKYRYQLIIGVLLLLKSCIGICAPTIRIDKVLGTWKIERRIYLMQNGANTRAEKVDFDSLQNICLQSRIFIEKDSIKISPSNACYFIDCKKPNYSIKKLYVDSGEDVFSDTVGSGFLRVIGIIGFKKTKEISVVTTSCKIDWGNDVMEIFYINKNEIALYCGPFVLILKK